MELDRQGTQDREFRCSPVTPMETLSQGGMLHRMELMCMQVQADFTRQIEEIETGKTFQIDEWKRPNNTGTYCFIILNFFTFQGGGITMVLQDGEVFEKSGVGISGKLFFILLFIIN